MTKTSFPPQENYPASAAADEAAYAATEAARAQKAREEGYPQRKTAAQLKEEMDLRTTLAHQLACEMKLRQWTVEKVMPVLVALAGSAPKLPLVANFPDKIVDIFPEKIEISLLASARDLTGFFYHFLTAE